MSLPAGESASEEPPLDARAHNREADYQRLLRVLAFRARRLGSRDPEAAAQEAWKRSLEHAASREAVEHFLREDPPDGQRVPDWRIEELLAWLNAVLQNVVREERNRVRYRREVPLCGNHCEWRNEAAGAGAAEDLLDVLIREELYGIAAECFRGLDREHRAVLRMRVDGLKYCEIAARLGVNENTVATWISRGMRELAQHVRRRSIYRYIQPEGSSAT